LPELNRLTETMDKLRSLLRLDVTLLGNINYRLGIKELFAITVTHSVSKHIQELSMCWDKRPGRITVNEFSGHNNAHSRPEG